MRKVKFRAWLKNEKKIDEVEMINFDDGRILVKNGHGLDYYPEAYDLIQYIDLTDLAGKCIYDKDIMLVDTEDGPCYFEVVFRNNREDLLSCHTLKYIRDATENDIVFGEPINMEEGYFHVVGNQFENPELLEV